MSPSTGAHLIAQAHHQFAVEVIFGLVGIPVVQIAEEAIALGIRFVAFRNEQAASYAATAYGYFTGRSGVCLIVGGPGVLHAMAGVGNTSAKPGCNLSNHYRGLQKLFLWSRRDWFCRLTGRYHPGPSRDTCNKCCVINTPITPRSRENDYDCTDGQVRKSAPYRHWKRSRLRSSRRFHTMSHLPTAMGKGVVPETHPSNVAVARPPALKNADFVFLLGARLN